MKTPVQTVMGHCIPEPAMTARAYALLALYVALPVLLVGMSLDLLVQWLFGWCVGFWCFV
ncbi:MAG: hypothetical protein KA778_13910 [Burkholderiaceae bacterium]|jgi:hypothetical protein|nr:hypothetical protein [Burkholderiaceae bacterium]